MSPAPALLETHTSAISLTDGWRCRDTVVSFMPDGNYADNAACSWLIDCATGLANPRPPVVRITQMDVESDYE